jgi:signal transduction histidine kinase
MGRFFAQTRRPRRLPVKPQAVRGIRRGMRMLMSAYRILQEALTNVLKHCGGAAARVRVRYMPELVELEVVDDGHSNGNHRIDRPPVRNSGHGLVGMRERASLYGGKLEAGPRAEGGFRVHAVLPIPATRASGSSSPMIKR